MDSVQRKKGTLLGLEKYPVVYHIRKLFEEAESQSMSDICQNFERLPNFHLKCELRNFSLKTLRRFVLFLDKCISNDLKSKVAIVCGQNHLPIFNPHAKPSVIVYIIYREIFMQKSCPQDYFCPPYKQS